MKLQTILALLTLSGIARGWVTTLPGALLAIGTALMALGPHPPGSLGDFEPVELPGEWLKRKNDEEENKTWQERIPPIPEENKEINKDHGDPVVNEFTYKPRFKGSVDY